MGGFENPWCEKKESPINMIIETSDNEEVSNSQINYSIKGIKFGRQSDKISTQSRNYVI